MSPTRVVVCAALVVFIGSFGIGFLGVLRVQQAEAIAADAQQECEGLRDALAVAERRARDAERHLAATEQRARRVDSSMMETGGTMTPQPANAAHRPEDTATTERRVADAEDILAASPDYQKLRVSWYRSTLPLNYGPIYRKLGLSADQIAAVERAFVTQFEENMEARAAAVSQGGAPSDPSLIPLTSAIAHALGKNLKDVLGVEVAKEFSAYVKTTAVRASAVDPLAGSLSYTDAPLTFTQAEQLTRIVGAHTGPQAQSGLVYSGRVTDWDAVLAEAAAVLAPAQLATFRTLRDREATQKKMGELADRLLREARAKERDAMIASRPKQ